jgi:hypothetical protein
MTNRSEGDGGFVIDWTATDSSSRGSPIEVNHSEFSIVKLCDAATPKLLEADGVLDYSGGDGVGSNTLMFHDDLIGWNFTNNTNNPVADGDTGGHSFVFGVELPDAVELDNVVEVFVRSDPWPADTAPDADWLLL